jgi:hypothetical protein
VVGYPSILPVIAEAPGWLDVELAQRPNESTAWIPANRATLSSTPYFLFLSLCNTHLFVFKSNAFLYDFPAGVGAPDDPTPIGNYFIAMITPPPDPGYGPFVLATSAHSNTINSWEGMGDAITAIHGPITAQADQAIGTTGARISHGCIRLHNSDLAELSGIPPGTPLVIWG